MAKQGGDRKYVYAFGEDRTEGRGEDKFLLGGKGAGLAQMSLLGIPVPPGFTITTEACTYFQSHDGAYPTGLKKEVKDQLTSLEKVLGQKLGDRKSPLLVSVRSGGPMSMPGMMDTVLNLGLNDATVEALIKAGTDARFIKDCYRRLLGMYGKVVLGVDDALFEEEITEARKKQGVETDAELSAESLDKVIERSKTIIAREAKPFPQDAQEQLWGAIDAVFLSWDNRRAREYRRLHHIADDLGTGVNIQAMVYGNRGPDCASGVAFTRNPATGENKLYGEYLPNAQGEDVVAGTRTPHAIDAEGAESMTTEFPDAHKKLQEVSDILEHHYRDMLDVEFTIENKKLYMLQTRVGKRTGPAAARIAVEMCDAGLINKDEALRRVAPEQLEQLLAPGFDPDDKKAAVAAGRFLARGLPAGPGAASGRIAFTADRAVEMAADGPVLLVREETSPEDIVGMHAAQGILTSRGGMTSHAAVVARGLGKPCIVGAEAILVNDVTGLMRVGNKYFREGDQLSIDGTTGGVLSGALSPKPSQVIQALLKGDEAEDPDLVHAFQSIMEWSDEIRRLGVRTNADTPEDSIVARTLGAQGIGLCRTEHMFFAEDRISLVRQMIIADDDVTRARVVAKLMPMQQADFEGIFEAMDGLPVTIRLLDPPLHEFLPHDKKTIEALALEMGVVKSVVAEKVSSLSELNPMLGHRGCRLGITAPEIYAMQVEAITRAACVRARAGDTVRPEIMVPLIGTYQELASIRSVSEEIVERVQKEEKQQVEILIGTMIEIPRACLVADKVAQFADFFSFGTNDLTQMTYGYSRDDAGVFLPAFVEAGILPWDPFARIDEEGVGQLMEIAVQRGRSTNRGLKLGICGEHGGEPHSVAFCHKIGLNYVSCSPYRVPIARLAAAHATLGGLSDTTK